MNCVCSSDLSLKYKRFTPLGWQDISIRKFEFVTKTQLLSEAAQMWLVPLKIVFNVLKFKLALN